MTDLVLVRHGETEHHAENRYAGRADVPLTSRGVRQAERLAAWARVDPPDRILASPLERARRTAEAAARVAGVPVTVDARLTEVDFGKGDGLTHDEMRARFPADFDAFIAAPATSPLPGGETGVDAVARALPVLDAATADHPTGTVLVVAHQTLLRLLLCRLLEIPLDRYRTVFPRLDNVARTVVRPAERGPAALLGLNLT